MRKKLKIILMALTLLGANKATAEEVTVKIVSQKMAAVHQAVVMLTPLSGQKVSISQSKATMAQQDTQFTPFILPVHKGTTVSFPNKDSFRHHVYSFSKSKAFELRLYGQDEKKTIVFDKEGRVALGCNIHDNMLAFIFVTEAPLFALSDPKGIAQFKDLPAGDYKLEVIHVDQKRKQPISEKIISLPLSGTKGVSYTLEMRDGRMIQGKAGEKSGRY